MNCNLIIGSVDEFERLWSIYTNLLTDSRKIITLVERESILFINVLKLLNNNTVKRLIDIIRSIQVYGRIK